MQLHYDFPVRRVLGGERGHVVGGRVQLLFEEYVEVGFFYVPQIDSLVQRVTLFVCAFTQGAGSVTKTLDTIIHASPILYRNI